MKRRSETCQAIYEAIAVAPEPFDCKQILAAIPVELKPYTVSHVSSKLYTLSNQGMLKRVTAGTIGRYGSHCATFVRTEKFSTVQEKVKRSTAAPAPAGEEVVPMSDLERRWREFRAGINTEVPEVALVVMEEP